MTACRSWLNSTLEIYLTRGDERRRHADLLLHVLLSKNVVMIALRLLSNVHLWGCACAPIRYAQRRSWKVDLLSYTEAETGGYKEVIAEVWTAPWKCDQKLRVWGTTEECWCALGISDLLDAHDLAEMMALKNSFWLSNCRSLVESTSMKRIKWYQVRLHLQSHCLKMSIVKFTWMTHFGRTTHGPSHPLLILLSHSILYL
jgi:hypothetical protein